MLPRKKRTNMDEKKLRQMKYPKVKKKKKFKRDCHNCTFFAACADRYHRNAVDCKGLDFVLCVKVHN